MADPADRVIKPVKNQLNKIFNRPSFYFSLFISLTLSLILIHWFVQSIGPAGMKSPVGSFFDYFIKILVSAFGESFVNHLFSQGPFGLAFIVASIPLLIFLMLASISQFNAWLNQNPEENDLSHIGLLAFNYILASIISLSILFLFFSTISIFTNLSFGNIFYIELLFSFLVLLGFWSYWFLIFILFKKKKGSILLSFFILILFIFTAISESMILDTNLTLLSDIFNFLIQWISPVHYFIKFLTAVFYNQSLLAIAYSLLLILIITIVSLTSLFLLKSKVSKERMNG